MKLKLRHNATAREIAELHRDLARAIQALSSVVVRENPILLAPSADALNKELWKLRYALLSLEGPWLSLAGPFAPLAFAGNPDLWCTYLDVKGRIK